MSLYSFFIWYLLGLTVNTSDIINDIAGLKQDKTLAKTLSVDSSTIDLALAQLAKLILGLNKNSKKTRKEQNLIKKIEEIRDTIQEVLYCQIEKEYKDEE